MALYAPALRVHCNDGHGHGYAADVRWTREMAESDAGTIRLAQYRYPSSHEFELCGEAKGN